MAARGHEILAASVDGTIRRFDARIGRAYCDDVRHPVTAAVFTNDGLCVLAACLDSTLRLLDKQTGAAGGPRGVAGGQGPGRVAEGGVEGGGCREGRGDAG